jgi:ATP-dependent helicase Lhr and Lhr-like helicase
LAGSPFPSDPVGPRTAPAPEASPPADPLAPIRGWFAAKGWAPLPAQEEVWAHYLAGRSGLLHAATGTGKTLAAWLGPVVEWLADPMTDEDGQAPPRVLWVTPLRALAADTVRSLQAPIHDLGLPWAVERRTGDTGGSVKRRQRGRLPAALVTTPESLSLLLSYPGTVEQLREIRAVIVDEWHELIGSKRGTLTELALARLRTLAPDLRVWGLSATLSNLEDARDALLGLPVPEGSPIVHGPQEKVTVIDTVLPETVERFPWAGHLGLQLAEAVAQEVDEAESALVFVNTRAQAERWYQALLAARPGWAGRMAVHHGSLARATRRFVEEAVADGRMKCVVATSSLDLGVDFPPVDRVIQIGSAKGVARLLQRAGRSGHQPGRPSRVTLVPTHSFELLEAAAAREAALARRIEPRRPLDKPLDVLAQHLITAAAGDPFEEEEMLAEVRSTWAYRDLDKREWDWVLRFAQHGGESLEVYEEYRRLTLFRGRWYVPTEAAVRAHRQTIGVIASDGEVEVKYRRGQRLGTVPESFAARLGTGDAFLLAGKALELIEVRDMTAYVRRAKNSAAAVPRYTGALLPISDALAEAVRQLLAEVARGEAPDHPELEALASVFEVQRRWSAIPGEGETLAERTETREGHHLFVYPFAGRLVHEALAALAAYRLAREAPRTFSLSANEYGFELLSAEPFAPDPAALAEAFSPDDLEKDLGRALNEAELAKRQFREVARVSGLVSPGLPGRGRSARQLQASAGLVYEVLKKHEPDSLLLHQARREVLDHLLELDRLRRTLDRIAAGRLVLVDTPRPTPFAFPVLTNRLREKVSSETAGDRIRRMQLALERAADR